MKTETLNTNKPELGFAAHRQTKTMQLKNA